MFCSAPLSFTRIIVVGVFLYMEVISRRIENETNSILYQLDGEREVRNSRKISTSKRADNRNYLRIVLKTSRNK